MVGENCLSGKIGRKEFETDTYIKGHHVYKDIWAPEIGESLRIKSQQLESRNAVDNLYVYKNLPTSLNI